MLHPLTKTIRIGTRESQLAVWQADTVKKLLRQYGYEAEPVYIKSEGDTDLQTPLYEIGVQGIFTKALDLALLNNEIDIAVHSMKDVPTHMAKGIVQAAVLARASHKDILVPRQDGKLFFDFKMWDDCREGRPGVIATGSARRRAQWLHRFPNDRMEQLRGNVNTRLRKLGENTWQGAIFAGLERIGLRPENAVTLDWMLPAPAQGAIVVVCREKDNHFLDACAHFHDEDAALCTGIERNFLRALLGGCTTPIGGLAEIAQEHVIFKGNILSLDGAQKKEVVMKAAITEAMDLGELAALNILQSGAREILNDIRNGK
jgi:hydroxymethylbilane synthase